MFCGSGMTSVEDQSTVCEKACALAALIPASCKPASARAETFSVGGTLTMGLGIWTNSVQGVWDGGGAVDGAGLACGQAPYCIKTALGMCTAITAPSIEAGTGMSERPTSAKTA